MSDRDWILERFPRSKEMPDASGSPSADYAIVRPATKEDWPENKWVHIGPYVSGNPWTAARKKIESEKSGELKIGEEVIVDHPRYHGKGILSRIEPARPAIAWVRLQHGEDRWYEADTVRSALARCGVCNHPLYLHGKENCRVEECGCNPAPLDLKNECRLCHQTMSTDDGCDPTDICHSCAHSEVDRLKQRIQELEDALKHLPSAHDFVSHLYKTFEYGYPHFTLQSLRGMSDAFMSNRSVILSQLEENGPWK